MSQWGSSSWGTGTWGGQAVGYAPRRHLVAPLNTPTIPAPKVPTQPAGDNSQAGANTAFVNAAITAALGAQLELGINATPPTVPGTVASAPPTSATIQTALGNLVLGTAWQNILSYDVWCTVYVDVTANTSLVVADGVGKTATPAQTTLVTGSTSVGIMTFRCKVPAGYYRLLSATGTQTSAIVGQYLEAA